MNIPQTGPNSQKSKFFSEIAVAFEFLAIFYTLPKDRQLQLLQFINKLQAKTREENENNHI